jgi:glyoxalase family protein
MTVLDAGIHHVSAIASDPQKNLDFYAGVLGLRLVKRTVNFDDPTTYHLYFGDEVGRPGTLITFFPWKGARRGRQGAGQVGVTSFAILPSALGHWLERLIRYHVPFEQPVTRFDGERVIAFKDPDGLVLELIAHPGAEAGQPWDGSDVPAEHAIRGLYSITIWEEGHEGTASVLVDHLGFKPTREQGSIYRFAAHDGRLGAIVDLRVVPGLWTGTVGAGVVHHVAFRIADDDAQKRAREQLKAQGFNVTPQLDRQYFKSVYFREPGGVLFELATEEPGFLTDEPAELLGRTLKLPPWLEARRFEIEALLPNVTPPIDMRLPYA